MGQGTAHTHLPLNQIGGEHRQAINLVVRPTELDLQVATFGVPDLRKAPA